MKAPRNLIFVLYTLPVAAWIGWTFFSAPLPISWIATLVGLTILFFGSTSLLAFWPLPQEVKEPPPESPSIIEEGSREEEKKALERISFLEMELKTTEENLNSTQNKLESALKEEMRLKDDLDKAQASFNGKEASLKKEMEDLEATGSHQQKMIQQLESQIFDLRYEIKTLLQLTEVDYTPLFTSEALASHPEEELLLGTKNEGKKILRRWISKLRKLPSNYRSLTLHQMADPFTFDLRHLKEMFSQTDQLIVAYSRKDKKVLMASEATESLTGLDSETFCRDFFERMGEEKESWTKEAEAIKAEGEVSFPMQFKSLDNKSAAFICTLGVVPSGPYRSLVLALFLPASSNREAAIEEKPLSPSLLSPSDEAASSHDMSLYS